MLTDFGIFDQGVPIFWQIFKYFISCSTMSNFCGDEHWTRAWIQLVFVGAFICHILPSVCPLNTWDRSCSNLLSVWDKTLLVDVWRHLLPDSPPPVLRPSPPCLARSAPLFPFFPGSLAGYSYNGATIACQHPKKGQFPTLSLYPSGSMWRAGRDLEIWNEMFTLAGAGSLLRKQEMGSSVDFPSRWPTGLGRSGIGPEAGGGGRLGRWAGGKLRRRCLPTLRPEPRARRRWVGALPGAPLWCSQLEGGGKIAQGWTFLESQGELLPSPLLPRVPELLPIHAPVELEIVKVGEASLLFPAKTSLSSAESEISATHLLHPGSSGKSHDWLVLV